MVRRARPSRLAAVVLVLASPFLLSGPTLACWTEVRDRGSRPNFVVIVADDLDYELFDAMPRLRGLLSRGRSFTNAHVTSPQCCPSRLSILRGQYAHSHGVFDNTFPDGGYGRAVDVGVESCTVATWLQTAGYQTALMGKYLNEYGLRYPDARHVPPGWDEWIALWKTMTYTEARLNINGRLWDVDDYLDDDLADRAVRFIDRAEKPYFLLLAPLAPHVPLTPAARYATAPTPFDSPEAVGRYRLMLGVEDLVARVLAAAGPRTYVIFTSDNGFHLDPKPGKRLPYESDTHVPLVVIGPGVQAGEDESLALNIDLAPTLAQLAGVSVRDMIEGRSLVALLAGERVRWRTDFLIEMPEYRALRTTDGLYVEWDSGRRELIGSGDRTDMSRRLDRLATCSGSDCRAL